MKKQGSCCTSVDKGERKMEYNVVELRNAKSDICGYCDELHIKRNCDECIIEIVVDKVSDKITEVEFN